MNAPIAVVTGANSGIGRATAVHLASKGLKVYGTVRDVSKATKLNAMAADAGVSVALVELDIADDASLRGDMTEIPRDLQESVPRLTQKGPCSAWVMEAARTRHGTARNGTEPHGTAPDLCVRRKY